MNLSYFAFGLESRRGEVEKRASYHHGDLPAALVDAAFELIGENGVHGFSVAEAARRTGVSISAPYRHFADRDALLAACATAACEELKRSFDPALSSHGTPADQLAAAIAAYVRFAAERRPMFEALFGAGLDKTKYPRLAEASGALLVAVAAPARKLTPTAATRRPRSWSRHWPALPRATRRCCWRGASASRRRRSNLPPRVPRPRPAPCCAAAACSSSRRAAAGSRWRGTG